VAPVTTVSKATPAAHSSPHVFPKGNARLTPIQSLVETESVDRQVADPSSEQTRKNGQVKETAMNETKMLAVNSTLQPRKQKLRRVLKVLSLVGLVVAASLVIAHLAWKYSGSNQWTLELDKNGIKIYSLKVPGSSLKQLKAVRRIKTTMVRAVGPMLEGDAESCAKWVPGCAGVETVEPWNSKELYGTDLWRMNLPSPFSPRELLLKTQVFPDHQTKAVRIDIVAFPDMRPRNKCCFRVEKMHNIWQFKPVENGQVEVEFIDNMDFGLPYLLQNLIGVKNVYGMFDQLPELLAEQQKPSDKLGFLDEMMAENRPR
jgi:hypothetical protein